MKSKIDITPPRSGQSGIGQPALEGEEINPSQFQGVGGSEMIEGIEAFTDCSVFDVECSYGLDRR